MIGADADRLLCNARAPRSSPIGAIDPFRSSPRRARCDATICSSPRARAGSLSERTGSVTLMRRREFIAGLGGAVSVAAGGAGAAAGEAADHRVLGPEHAFGQEPMDRRFCAAAARTRLDRGPHRRDRVSLGRGTHRALRRDRGRIRPAQGRCHRHVGQPPPSLRQSRRQRSSRSSSR